MAEAAPWQWPVSGLTEYTLVDGGNSSSTTVASARSLWTVPGPCALKYRTADAGTSATASASCTHESTDVSDGSMDVTWWASWDIAPPRVYAYGWPSRAD